MESMKAWNNFLLRNCWYIFVTPQFILKDWNDLEIFILSSPPFKTLYAVQPNLSQELP